MKYSNIKKTDSAVYNILIGEDKRQSETLMMIPSENIVSSAVEEAMSSRFGNKYAEGYPGRRYYAGNHYADQIEELCVDRACKLFDVPYANVQPHSGSPANLAVQFAILKPGDTILGLSLSSGGHLTHGAKLSASSTFYKSVQYEVDENGFLDYEEIEKLAVKSKPKLIIAGTTAYPRIIDWSKFAKIADKCGAYLMCDIAHISGLVAAKIYPSPASHAHIITTTTHKSLRGPRGAMIMITEKGLAFDPELPKKINMAIIPGIQGGPHLNSIAALAVALNEAKSPRFKVYARNIVKNASYLSDRMSELGFDLVTGGTDSHLILADLRKTNIIGNTMATCCEKAGIILNRNGVPHDPSPPYYPNGIRLGTPAVTSRQMGKKEMYTIADILSNLILELTTIADNEKITAEMQKDPGVRQRLIGKVSCIDQALATVRKMCKQFPIRKTY